nr:hypothetical protein [Tanacetum cinerariifolium]
MSTQQEIYAAGSENRPLMFNKENYVPWSSRLLRFAKSRPNGKLIHNSIINGLYVRRLIPEPGDTNREVSVNETFHVQTYELTEKELKQIEADDQAIQTILLGLPEDMYAVVDSCETAQEIWLRVQQMMKGSDIGIQEKKAKLFNEWERFTSNDMESIESYYHRNLNGYNVVQNVGNQVAQNTIHNPRVSNVGNQNGLIGVPGNANHNGNGNLVAARAKGNAAGHNGNQIGVTTAGEWKEEAGIQLQVEEFDLMEATVDLDEIEEVNANYRSAEVHEYENCYDKEIFNMFTQEEQYTELLEPIPEPLQVLQNDNDVIYEVASVEQSEGTVEQHPANVEETRALYDSLYHNLAVEVEKVNTVNRKLKETNAKLTIELARFKNQEKCFEISQEKYDKLERCYQKSAYQEQCLFKKINALHLSFDELLDKQIQLKKKIKEWDNILVKTGQSIQTIHMLSPKLDSFYHTEQKMALGYQNPFYLKQARKKQQSLYDGKVLLEKHDPPVVHNSEETLQLAQEVIKR